MNLINDRLRVLTVTWDYFLSFLEVFAITFFPNLFFFKWNRFYKNRLHIVFEEFFEFITLNLLKTKPLLGEITKSY